MEAVQKLKFPNNSIVFCSKLIFCLFFKKKVSACVHYHDLAPLDQYILVIEDGRNMGKVSLAPVVNIDEKKCINCYACITGCPVKYCIDGSGEKIVINHDLCIGCGNCIPVCNHNARNHADDSGRFFEDLKNGIKVIALVAPAIASVFPEKFLNLNGWLKSLDVDAIFDVSFGAELTVLSYLDHIKRKNPRTVIAQPCPAIVSYIQIYHPELLPYLAPADSPMMHTIKMIREYYPEYRVHNVAVISPCLAKKREFVETGFGDYNVTMLSLKNYIDAHNIDISAFPRTEYAGLQAERAAGFSSPGGLLDTAERFAPGIRRRTHKIEGVHSIYHYLEAIGESLDTDVELPLLVDCLNCEKGCNGGPGTGNGKKSLVALESPIRKRISKLEEYHKTGKGDRVCKKYHKTIAKFWKADLYRRSYLDLSGNNFIEYPKESDLEKIYHSMKKLGKEDLYDCTSCGYGSCKSMATAIHNKLNKPQNCAHYILALHKEDKKAEEQNRVLMEHVNSATKFLDGITTIVHDLSKSIDMQAMAVEESSRRIEVMLNSLNNTSLMSKSKQDDINELIGNAAMGQASMKETIQSVQDISWSVDGIVSAIRIISSVASNTNLLSMNAAIEAAHAGDAGTGFAVVAGEIRRLAESTRENSHNISRTLKSIINAIDVASKQSGDTNARINEMSGEINDFAKTMTSLIGTFTELSSESNDIIIALESLKVQSGEVKSLYGNVLSMTDKLRDSMHELTAMAGANATLQ